MMDTALKQYVSQYVTSESWDVETRQTVLKSIIAALMNEKQDQLLAVVVDLEEVLQDKTNPTGRKNAVRLLCDCISSEESKLKLNFKHVETLALFFCAKLGDWQCVDGAVNGLLALFQHYGAVLRTLKDEKNDPLATVIVRALFKEVHTPSHTQSVRNTVLVLTSLLIAEWRTEVEVLGEALGEGIAATVEEERDPRNLLLSFRLVESLFEKCKPDCVSAASLESLFEALVSYFPITFTPPKDDKFGITGDDLRLGLARALSASSRQADLVLPFLLDASKDISVGDSDTTIKQALELLGVCVERFGPEVAKSYIVEILKTSQDQVCRTTTPCPAEFAESLRISLGVLLRDVPSGLHPAWLSRLVDPALKTLAEDAARGDTSLASGGSRRLLLAAAAAHPVLMESTWTMASTFLLPKVSAEETVAPVLEQSAIPFVLNFVRLAEGKNGPLLRPRQLKPALRAAVAVLRTLEAGGAEDSNAEDKDGKPIFAMVVELIGRLCQLIGDDDTSYAFTTLYQVLVPSASVSADDSTMLAWRTAWSEKLALVQGDDVCLMALLTAVLGIVGTQPARALELSLALQSTKSSEQLPSMLPQLVATAACSISRLAVGEVSGDESKASEAAQALLSQAASLVVNSNARLEAIGALADALGGSTTTKSVSHAARSWAASHLARSMDLPKKLASICEGVNVVNLEGALSDGMSQHSRALQRLLQVLSRSLPATDATNLRHHMLELASAERSCVILVKAALPEAAGENWDLCLRVLKSLQLLVEEATMEAPAVEALEALVESCPPAQVEGLITEVRTTFGGALTGAGAAPRAARSAALCWAVTTCGLLKRGGFATQTSAFLETLLSALEKEGPATCFVPLAFQVLMPPCFDAKSSAGKLPPIALQQLSRTTLPLLVKRAKASASSNWNASGAAALESAMSLLCSLPLEVAYADCMDDLRWCVLTSLKQLSKEASGQSASVDATTFAAQSLQLLVRAMRKGTSWVEDDLQSVVPPLTAICTHGIPLVRLGCFQALSLLIEAAHGHLTPYRKMVEKATRFGVEDKKREVRLVAIQCLNSWHCRSLTD